VRDFAPQSTYELLLSLERWELEQLGHKVHRLQHQDLAGSWHECSHAVCVRLRGWLGLLPDDRDAPQPANVQTLTPQQMIGRIRSDYDRAQVEVARAHALLANSNALLHQARLTREASRQARTRPRSC
jgi:hypothetical protein